MHSPGCVALEKATVGGGTLAAGVFSDAAHLSGFMAAGTLLPSADVPSRAVALLRALTSVPACELWGERLCRQRTACG